MASVAVTDSPFSSMGLSVFCREGRKRSLVAIKPERLLEHCTERDYGGWKVFDFDDRTRPRPSATSDLYILSIIASVCMLADCIDDI